MISFRTIAPRISSLLLCLLFAAAFGELGCAIHDPYAGRYDPYAGLEAEKRAQLRVIWEQLDRKDWAGAERSSRSLIAEDPKQSMAHVLLALSLMGQDKLDAAEQVFGDAIRAEPGNAIARYNLGNLYARKKAHKAAALQFREAVRLDPRYRAAWLNLAVARANSRNIKGAQRAIDKALSFDEKYPRAMNIKATLLIDQGLAKEASGMLRELVERSPRVAIYHLNYARALEQTERPEDAAVQYRRFLDLAPREDEDRKLAKEALKRLRKP